MTDKKKILIVDDEKSVTDVFRMNLESMGEYEVMAENSSSDAVNTARRFKPDLVLLDVMMPAPDGGQVAAQIRIDPELKNTPIVFLTAAVTKEEAGVLSDRIGGFPFIAKPVNMEELASAVKRYAG